MVRTMFAKISAGAVMSLVLFAWSSQANAFGHHHGWGGSYGSSGGSWGGSSGGWGGSSGGGSWGGHWGHHWRWGGSSGGSSGGYWGGSSGGSSGGWGSSGGSSGGSAGRYDGSSGGSSVGVTYYDSPGVMPVDPSVIPPAGTMPAPAPGTTVPPAPAPGGSTTSMRADGLLSVNVPEDAKIFVNGQATSSTGDARQYVSRDLASGYNYTYEVRAEVVRDGRTVEQVKKVDLRAGETAKVAFDFGGNSTSAVETSLTLHVPADAKVYLAGNSTKAGGETRVFRTTGLSGNKGWDNYTVRVELERGGRMLTKEETISLKAGQSQELSFEFDGDKIASR